MINFTPTVSTVSLIRLFLSLESDPVFLSDRYWILTWSPGCHPKVFKASCWCWLSTEECSLRILLLSLLLGTAAVSGSVALFKALRSTVSCHLPLGFFTGHTVQLQGQWDLITSPHSSGSFINPVTGWTASEGNLCYGVLTSLLWGKGAAVCNRLTVRDTSIPGKLWAKGCGVPVSHFPHKSTHNYCFNMC